MLGDLVNKLSAAIAARFSLESIIIGITASVIVVLIIRVLILAVRNMRTTILPYWEARRQLKSALTAVDANSPSIWLAQRPPKFIPDYKRRIAMARPTTTTIANLKGGVGKTTVSACLAARYAIAGEKVLLVDLDFQGSLSSMALPVGERRPGPGLSSKASLFIGASDRKEIREPQKVHLPYKVDACLHCIPAFYDLANTEARVMIEWLLGLHNTDIRYWIADTLLSIEYQNYDRVIIDAPPRLVTGCVQALCASQTVIIPTILDGMSVEAVDTFLVQLRDHREIWPMLSEAYVVPTMTSASVNEIAERDALRQLQDILKKRDGAAKLVPKDAYVRHNQLLSRASGKRIAYGEVNDDQAHRDLRANFDRLSGALARGNRDEQVA